MKNSPDLRFDDFKDRLDQVRVASWPDGVELWRTGLAVQGPDDPTVRLSFRTAEEREDWSTTQILDTAGFSAGFILLPNIDPPLLSTLSSNLEELDRFSKHGRWVLTALGMREAKHSPVWHQPGGNGSVASPMDPFVCRLTTSWEEAYKEARRLDVRLRDVHRWYSGGGRQGARRRFVDVEGETGSAGVCDDVVSFFDGLVQIGWVKVSSEPLRMSGELKCTFLRPTGRDADEVRRERKWTSATKVPAGWSTTSSLDLERNLGVHDVVKWLEDDWRDRVSQPFGIPSVWAQNRQHEQLLILPESSFDSWFEENTTAGQLTIYGDELEVFRMLGEDLPYLWTEPKLRAWALERWG